MLVSQHASSISKSIFNCLALPSVASGTISNPYVLFIILPSFETPTTLPLLQSHSASTHASPQSYKYSILFIYPTWLPTRTLIPYNSYRNLAQEDT